MLCFLVGFWVVFGDLGVFVFGDFGLFGDFGDFEDLADFGVFGDFGDLEDFPLFGVFGDFGAFVFGDLRFLGDFEDFADFGVFGDFGDLLLAKRWCVSGSEMARDSPPLIFTYFNPKYDFSISIERVILM